MGCSALMAAYLIIKQTILQIKQFNKVFYLPSPQLTRVQKKPTSNIIVN